MDPGRMLCCYEEEHMVFVLDKKGSSKVIDEKDRARFIRCLAESEDEIR